MTAPAERPPAVAVARVEGPTKARFFPRKRRPVARIGLGVAAVAAALGILFAKLRPLPVTTTVVIRGTAIEAVYATGTVEPFDRVIVKAKVAGSVDLKVREGARVKKGDLLAIVDSPALRHELARGKADLWAASQQATTDAPQVAALDAQARALDGELKTARADLARTSNLVASGAVARTELDRLVDRVTSLEAQLEANASQRKSLRIDLTARALGSGAAVDSLAARLADAEVRSPMDGVVLARFVEPGEVAMVNSPILKVGEVENLILECAVDEADIGKVAPGKEVAISLYAFPQAVVRGQVFDILPDADRAKKSFLTKVKFVEPPAGLRSGMTAEANIVIEQRPGSLLVPAEAVSSSGAVLVVEGGRAWRRTPTLGVRDMLRVEVTAGLNEGDPVVVSGIDALRDGARVKAIVKPPFDGTVPSGVARAKMSL